MPLGRVLEQWIGCLFAFVGFLTIIFMIRADQEIGLFPIFNLLFGSALLIHGSVEAWYRWLMIGGLVLIGTALFIHGRVEEWHKLVFIFVVLPAMMFGLFVGLGKKKDRA